jgi:hypothetical protein
LPSLAIAEAGDNLTKKISPDLTHHVIGYLSIFIAVASYITAISEDVIELRKSKPLVLGSSLVCFVICGYSAMHGDAKTAAIAFESNLLTYVELLLFILVSMTYINTLEECGIFLFPHLAVTEYYLP